MKDEQKKSQRKQAKAQKANQLRADYQREKDLKNEAYFFIIESGNFDNFKNWVYDRHENGLTAATAHKECLMYFSAAIESQPDPTASHQPTPTPPASQPDPKDELIETLRGCNATQRKLIQLQEERITRLTELLAAAKGVK